MAATATKERPIIFSSEMVRAILDGRKTQTRRVVKPQPIGFEPQFEPSGKCVWWHIENDKNIWEERCCPFQAGVTLWVRETFDIESFGAGVAQIRYRADGARGRNAGVSDRKLPDRCGCVPSIHMPRHCSRITLEVTDVRVEQVQAITRRDIIAEGVDDNNPVNCGRKLSNEKVRMRFGLLWDSINENRGYSWRSNPWVWVIGFRQVEN